MPAGPVDELSCCDIPVQPYQTTQGHKRRVVRAIGPVPCQDLSRSLNFSARHPRSSGGTDRAHNQRPLYRGLRLSLKLCTPS